MAAFAWRKRHDLLHSTKVHHIQQGVALAKAEIFDGMARGGLAILNGEVTRQGAMIGYANVFSWMAIISLLLWPLLLLMKPAQVARPPSHEVHAD